ncbi:DDE-type integrase/transposase/recombinase [Croceicoccus sp. YJ47]|uniref:DDE-type integrase/transposase/recombinase n=1 Tax=Croceicoccus sp. YJ47 TaxID=2798724 RepID=UPI0019209AC9|nr:IS6 family transposase [Croceicoccus sp. YJ47]
MTSVDQEGEPLESCITKTREKGAAQCFTMKALKRHGSPDVITTDGRRSSKAAMSRSGHSWKQEMGCCASNRAENSRLPLRRRERAMRSGLGSCELPQSLPNARSPTVKLTRHAAQPHWCSGRTSRPEEWQGKVTFCKTESGLHPTDNSAYVFAGDGAKVVLSDMDGKADIQTAADFCTADGERPFIVSACEYCRAA